MSKVVLVELSAENWEAVARMQVQADQMNFVVDNLWTIAETQFYPWARRRVILAHGRIVGFAVYGMHPDDQTELWLHRFMVAAEEQRAGVGRAALRLLIEEWKTTPNLRIVKLSYEPDNTVAERLYASEGFIPGELAKWGERIATLDLTKLTCTEG